MIKGLALRYARVTPARSPDRALVTQAVAPVLLALAHEAVLLPYVQEAKSMRKKAQPQVWHAGDVSASPKQVGACKLARVARAWHARPLREHRVLAESVQMRAL